MVSFCNLNTTNLNIQNVTVDPSIMMEFLNTHFESMDEICKKVNMDEVTQDKTMDSIMTYFYGIP
jgi:hypothetical protein